jgi:hypothetical protein
MWTQWLTAGAVLVVVVLRLVAYQFDHPTQPPRQPRPDRPHKTAGGWRDDDNER